MEHSTLTEQEPRRLVTLDPAFFERVYKGPDPERFRRLIERAIQDPRSFVCATHAHSLGLAVLHPDQPELGNVAVGHYLAGDWALLRHCLDWAQQQRADCYVYPLNYANPQFDQLYRVLTQRYRFHPYQVVLKKELSTC